MTTVDVVKYPKYNRPRKLGAYNCVSRNCLLLSQLPFPSRVLDIGCGVGDTTKLLTLFNSVVHVLAIDKTPECIAVADCFNDDLRIRYELADIEDFFTLPKPSEATFDLATAFHSLQKVQNHELTIRSIGKALKKGGYLLCALPARPGQRDLDLDEFLYQSERWRQYRPKKYPTRFESPWMHEQDPASWYRQLLDRNDFVVERCETITEEIAIREDEALEYLKMSRLCNFNVTESEHAEFMEQTYEAYSKSCQQMGGGYVEWKFDIIDIVARKT